MVNRQLSDASHNAAKNTGIESSSIRSNSNTQGNLSRYIRRLSLSTDSLETSFAQKERLSAKSTLRRAYSLNDLHKALLQTSLTPKYAILDSDKEVKFPKQEISRFLLGFTQYSQQGLSDFVANPELFFNSLTPNTLTANALFPTHRKNDSLCPVVTDEVRQEFFSEPLLRATHRELANLALAKFKLKCVDKSIQVHQSIEKKPPLWLQKKGFADRKMLFQMAESLFLLGNEELALSLCDTAISLLSRAELCKSTKHFKVLRTKITKELALDVDIRLAEKRVEKKDTRLQQARDLLKSFHNETKSQLFIDLIQAVPMSPSTKSELLEHLRKDNISQAIKKAKEVFLSSSQISQANKEKGLKRKLIDQYETRGWTKLESNIDVLNTNFSNTLTPHNSLHLDSNNEALTIFERNIKKNHGISCYSTNLETSAANLWHSELYDTKGKQLFSGMRHASLSYRPGDKENRERNQQIVKGKVKELIFSALLSKYKKEIENRVKGLADNTTPIKLKLASVSLLTLFDMQLGPVKESEGGQFEQQRIALENLQHELTTVIVNKVAIPVQIESITFSTGVNDLAMNPTKATSFIYRSNWRKADPINRISLERLLGSTNIAMPLGGWAKEALDNLSASKEDRIKKKMIKALAQDIKQIFSNRLHHRENHERYALPKRLAFLSYLIGAVPCFNCKSGKDRTGMLDAEIKALAASLSVIDSPDKSINTTTEVATLQSFHLDLLNFHVQKLNSGLSGNKVMAHDSDYFKEVFTAEQLGLMKGLI